jgi:hypothetical protein
MMDLSDFSNQNTKVDNQDIVSIKTEYYKRGKRFYASKVITPIVSLSKGHTITDEVNDYGLAVLDLITNLYEVEDGYYQIVINNISRDYETGHIDDYDFKLYPYEKKQIDT